MNLLDMTPPEIDAILYDLYLQEGEAEQRLSWAADAVHRAAADSKNGVGTWGLTFTDARTFVKRIAMQDATYAATEAKRALDRFAEAKRALYDIRASQTPYDNEFIRRDGWNRAYLVQNDNGHVHNTMRCSTCNRGGQRTRFAWMVGYSGKPEQEIVEAAADRACTVCYPSAPVDVLKRPTKMFGPEEIERKKAKEERERKSAENKAKAERNAITDVDGGVLFEHAPSKKDRGDKLRTLMAARTRLVDFIQYRDWGWGNPGDFDGDIQHLTRAIAAKEDAYPAEVLEAAQLRAKKRK